MFCIKYSNKIIDENGNVGCSPWYGFLKPWNGVRDGETYSLTYLPPSVINGIETSIGVSLGSILRHKLTFSKKGMQSEQVKTTIGSYWENGVEKRYVNKHMESSVHMKHKLVNPEIVLGFSTFEDAESAYNSIIYLGQNDYTIFPSKDFGIVEMTDNEFDNLPGVETFETDDEYAVNCGFNRFKENKPQYVDIVRVEWD